MKLVVMMAICSSVGHIALVVSKVMTGRLSIARLNFCARVVAADLPVWP